MGNWDTNPRWPLSAHGICSKRCFIQNNWDSYKGETKIPHTHKRKIFTPPHPHKRKNFFYEDEKYNIFSYMTALHVYTYVHTYTRMIHTHTQISYRKRQHKCCHDELRRCRKTDESLVKALQVMPWRTMWRYSTILKCAVHNTKYQCNSPVNPHRRCNDERATLQLRKPSRTWNVKVKGCPLCCIKRWWILSRSKCGRKYLAHSCSSTQSLRRRERICECHPRWK